MKKKLVDKLVLNNSRLNNGFEFETEHNGKAIAYCVKGSFANAVVDKKQNNGEWSEGTKINSITRWSFSYPLLKALSKVETDLIFGGNKNKIKRELFKLADKVNSGKIPLFG